MEFSGIRLLGRDHPSSGSVHIRSSVTVARFGRWSRRGGAQSQLVNDTFYGNSASGGPGGSGTYTYWGLRRQGQPYFIDVPFVGTTGSGTGGGLSSYGTRLANTIVAQDANGTGGGATASDIDGSVSGGYNLIGTGGSGGLVDGDNGNQVGVANPGLDPTGLQNNGGPTQTIALLVGTAPRSMQGATHWPSIPPRDCR